MMEGRKASVEVRRQYMEPTMHLLNFELYVAKIPKDSLSSATHSLLQILLRLFSENPDCRRNHFFSFTETSLEYSVILDKELLKILDTSDPKSKIEVTESKWRPLVVEVGPLGSLTGISNIVASVISPLASHGISLFCLSTNLDDFVLIKQSDLKKALSYLSRNFKLVCDSDHKVDLAMVQSVVQKLTKTDSPMGTSYSSGEVRSRPIVHPYTCSSNQYSICGVVPRALTSIGTSLLQLMLFNPRTSSEENFLSFSVVENDISIVMDTRDIARFPEDCLYLNKDTWRMIRIGGGPLGFDECGIVAQMAGPLAQAQISAYYICAFSTDHTLVPEGSVDKALKVLNDMCIPSKKLSNNGLICNGHSPLSNCTNTLQGAS